MGNHTLHPGRKVTSLDGTNVVTVCKAPSSDLIREVHSIRLVNIDAAVITVTLKRSTDGATATQIDKTTGLAVDGTYMFADTTRPIILYPQDTLTAVMSGAKNTTNPIMYVEYHDYRFWQ